MLSAPTVTKIWLRYYLDQIFGERWRKAGVEDPPDSALTRRRSRITYDRQQGLRYYNGAESTDNNECEDI